MAADKARRSRYKNAHVSLFPHHPSVNRSSAECRSRMQVSVQLLRLDLDIPLARRLLLPVLLHPCLEGLACRRIPARKRESGYIGIGNIHLGRRVRRDDANERIGERGTGASIEEVAH